MIEKINKIRVDLNPETIAELRSDFEIKIVAEIRSAFESELFKTNVKNLIIEHSTKVYIFGQFFFLIFENKILFDIFILKLFLAQCH